MHSTCKELYYPREVNQWTPGITVLSTHIPPFLIILERLAIDIQLSNSCSWYLLMSNLSYYWRATTLDIWTEGLCATENLPCVLEAQLKSDATLSTRLWRTLKWWGFACLHTPKLKHLLNTQIFCQIHCQKAAQTCWWWVNGNITDEQTYPATCAIPICWAPCIKECIKIWYSARILGKASPVIPL